MSPIAIVDYGIGNLGSVLKGFRHLGLPAALCAEREALAEASLLVLPGDGAFGAAMEELRRRGLLEPLLRAVRAGTPLLGICLGMQLLFDSSEEMGHHAGLGLLRGRVRRLSAGLPVPHMGWNTLHPRRDHAVLDGVAEGAHVYFVHSYYCEAEPSAVIATTDYGFEFPAVVGAGAVLGLQFHPEKSQGMGLRILGNAARALAPGLAALPASAAAP